MPDQTETEISFVIIKERFRGDFQNEGGFFFYSKNNRKL